MSQFILPSRATDANNSPLSGALLYFTLEGTTTPTDTYSDAERTTEHANPVVASSSGLFPAIYLNPEVSYRAVLKTAAGVALDEYDPYSPSDANLTAAAYYGASGDGSTDDTAALQAALNTGRVIALEAGATYLISSGLTHVTGAGFVCFDGVATIKAKTGAGGFNIKTQAAPRTGIDRNMLYCNATDDLTLLNIHFTTDNVSPCVLAGVRLLGGMATAGYNIQGISFSRFFVGQLVAIGSVGSGRKRNLHIASAVDCGTSEGNTYWTGGIQTTVVEIDNDLVASTPSKEGTIRIDLIRDILLSGQALTDFGQETDGVNIVCQGANSTSGWDIEIGLAERIGELVDIQGWRNSVRIGTAKSIYNDVVKLIHGAQFNNVEIGTVSASGRSVVNVCGSDSVVTDRDTKGNTVRVGTVTLPGTYGLGLTGASGDVMGVLFSNSASTWKPKENVVKIDSIVGDGVNLDHVVKDGGAASSNDNLVVIDRASGWAVSSVSAPPGNVRVAKRGRGFCRVTMSGSQAIASATATKVAFNTVAVDTETLSDAANSRFLITWPGLYHIKAQIRMDSWAVGASDSVILDIRQNGTSVQYVKAKINFSAKDETVTVIDTLHIREDNVGSGGTPVEVYVTQDTGVSKSITNNANMTHITIERVG